MLAVWASLTHKDFTKLKVFSTAGLRSTVVLLPWNPITKRYQLGWDTDASGTQQETLPKQDQEPQREKCILI